ncbi:hypothetical protein C8R44DRAFT_745768 [Mycena epipterygia]|nr:hypothetical protein C8R44DRAFT_745768 [Mycena epipterygia]
MICVPLPPQVRILTRRYRRDDADNNCRCSVRFHLTRRDRDGYADLVHVPGSEMSELEHHLRDSTATTNMRDTTTYRDLAIDNAVPDIFSALILGRGSIFIGWDWLLVTVDDNGEVMETRALSGRAEQSAKWAGRPNHPSCRLSLIVQLRRLCRFVSRVHKGPSLRFLVAQPRDRTGGVAPSSSGKNKSSGASGPGVAASRPLSVPFV